jgi:hypothetical protein
MVTVNGAAGWHLLFALFSEHRRRFCRAFAVLVMLRAKHLLVDRQRALEERSRSHKVALSLQQEGEIIEA